MKFICDEMLQGLGRWLRAAGYDTEIVANGTADSELLRFAKNESRLFITRDRQIPVKDFIVRLESNHMPDCMRELSQKLPINWQMAPFSRCLICNHLLTAVDEKHLSRVPRDVLARSETVLYCAVCDKVYWEGTHVRRMRKKLANYAMGVWDKSGR